MASPTTDVVKTMVTDRSEAPPDGTVLQTPGPGRPNVVVTLMTPIAQVVVRALRTYLQSLVGFLLASLVAKPALEGVGVSVPVGDFMSLLIAAAGLSVAPTVISVLQNAIELLAKLDAMFPKARA